MRASFRELGPLRSIAVFVTVVPTLGAVLLLANLPALAAALPSGPGAAFAVVSLCLGIATGAALVLPSAAAFGAGYCIGAEPGTWAALSGISLGSLLARFLLPRLGDSWFAFLRGRPRATAVRRFCSGGALSATLGVARLRWAALLPLFVTNLLFAVAAVPVRSVLSGSLLGALPGALLAAVVGDSVRTWRASGELPGPRTLAVAAAALVGAACLLRASRRAWRTASAPALPETRRDVTSC